MMERAEAIKVLEKEFKHRTDGYITYLANGGKCDSFEEEYFEAFTMAIAALREQEQREHGCEWCWHFSNDPQHLLSLGNGMYTEIIYKFCPMCGVKMDRAI